MHLTNMHISKISNPRNPPSKFSPADPGPPDSTPHLPPGTGAVSPRLATEARSPPQFATGSPKRPSDVRVVPRAWDFWLQAQIKLNCETVLLCLFVLFVLTSGHFFQLLPTIRSFRLDCLPYCTAIEGYEIGGFSFLLH